MGACFGKKGFTEDIDLVVVDEGPAGKKPKGKNSKGRKVNNPMMLDNLGEDSDEDDELSAVPKEIESQKQGKKKGNKGKTGKKGKKGKGKKKDKGGVDYIDNPMLVEEEEIETVTIEEYSGNAAESTQDEEADPLFDGTEADQTVLSLGSGNKPLYAGTLLKLGGGEGKNKWQARTFSVNREGLSWRNAAKKRVQIPLEDIFVVRPATAEEAPGQPVDCCFVLRQVNRKDEKRYKMCARSPEARRNWLTALAEVRKMQLILHSALGPSATTIIRWAKSHRGKTLEEIVGTPEDDHEPFSANQVNADPEAILSGAYGEVNCVLSCAQKENIEVVAEALQLHCTNEYQSPSDVFAWCAPFSLCDAAQAEGFAHTVTKKCLKRCQHTLLLMTPWQKPRWAEDIWCGYHAYESAIRDDIKVTAIQTQGDEQSLLKALRDDSHDITGFNQELKLLNSYDIAEVARGCGVMGRASYEEEAATLSPAARLMKSMTSDKTGSACINEEIKAVLWGWLRAVAGREVARTNMLRGEARELHAGPLLKLGGPNKDKWQKRDFALCQDKLLWKTRLVQEATRKKTVKTTSIPLDDINWVRSARQVAKEQGEVLDTQGTPVENVFIVQGKDTGYKGKDGKGKQWLLAADNAASVAEWVSVIRRQKKGKGVADDRTREDFQAALSAAKLELAPGGDARLGTKTCVDALKAAAAIEVVLFGDGSSTGELRDIRDAVPKLKADDAVVLGLKFQLAMAGPNFKAVPTLRELVASAEKTHGQYSEHYVELRVHLAEHLRKQGEMGYAEAMDIFADSIQRMEGLLSTDHIDLVKAKACYAHLLGSYTKDHTAAKRLREQVVQSETRTLGLMHPDTLISKTNLAVTFNRMKRASQAQKLYLEVLEAKAETLGDDNESTCTTKLSVAKTVKHADLQGAVEYLQEIMDSRKANADLQGTSVVSEAGRLLPHWQFDLDGKDHSDDEEEEELSDEEFNPKSNSRKMAFKPRAKKEKKKKKGKA